MPPVMRCADLTTLWRALRLWAEQFLYQAVIQPDRMLTIVHLKKFDFGDKPNFFSLLRLKRRCCAFSTTLSVWVDRDVYARKIKLYTFSTPVPLMWIRGCSLCCFLKSTIISFVFFILNVRLFS